MTMMVEFPDLGDVSGFAGHRVLTGALSAVDTTSADGRLFFQIIVSTIANALGVSRATLYRHLGE
ncbi:hypothetical protein AQI95_00535 [Streptomyces yokosukanensis]|uniref:Uncharacterized protein n=1 Tax=Streptomyces yokosukanensis TaxID=67386 RepID=A0A117Q5Y2_9ACTN|nr:hypothetical protein AQI95_00535 [Streptomyces yokosukanensis]